MSSPNSIITHGVAREEIATKVLAFAGEKPEFWAYYADYDWAACQLFGTMMTYEGLADVLSGCQAAVRQRRQPEATKQDEGSEHNALADAIWTKEAGNF